MNREHRLSKDKPYPSVGDWNAPKGIRNAVLDEPEVTTAPAEQANLRDVSVMPNAALTTVEQETFPMLGDPAESAIAKTSKETLLPQLRDAVRDRTSLDDDTIGACIEEYGGGALLTLKMCMPLVDEMKRRFKILDRKKQVNGTYKTIRGCRTFQEYCQKVLHRTEQAVYLMLRDGTPKSSEASKTDKPKTTKPVKEIKELADAIPLIRNGRKYTPPSQYSAADIVETVTKFTDNLVNQRPLTPSDRETVYYSIIRTFQDILAEMNHE